MPNNVKQRRLRLGLSQAQLANYASVGQTTVSLIERNLAPNSYAIRDVERALDRMENET